MTTLQTAPAPRKSRAESGEGKSARTRRALLDAAAEAFAQRGYSQTRLSDIVASVGIHPASIYYHFASKDALVEEVLTIAMSSGMRFVHEAVDALAPDTLAIDRIVTAVAAHLHIILELGDYVAAALRILGEVPRSGYDKFMADHLVYARYWEKLLADAESAGEIQDGLDLPVLRAVLVAAIGWRVDWHIDVPPSADEVTDTVLKSFVMGIATPASVTRILGASRDVSRAAVATVAARFER